MVIQKLADQAKMMVPEGLVVNDWVAAYNKAFAKLVIDECITIMHQQERLPAGYFYPKDTNTHQLAILDHFGLTLSKKEKFERAFEEVFKDGADLSGKNTP